MISRPTWVGWLAVAAVGGCMTFIACGSETDGNQNGEGGAGGDGGTSSTSSAGGAGGGMGGAGGTGGGAGGVGGTGGAGGAGGAGGGGGGAGGVGGSGGVGGGAGGAGGGAGGAGGAGGSGGSGGAPACYDKSCAEYITEAPPEPWCDEVVPDPTPGMTNPSYVIYNDLVVCVCGDPSNPAVGGTCKVACMNEACAGMNVTPGGACQMCIVDTTMGCGNEFNACANDF